MAKLVYNDSIILVNNFLSHRVIAHTYIHQLRLALAKIQFPKSALLNNHFRIIN